MKKREQYHLNRLLSKEMEKQTIRIISTPSKEKILRNVFNLREGDINHDGWYNRGFIFFRFLNDVIEMKTITIDSSKSLLISMDEESIRSYFNYLIRLEGRFSGNSELTSKIKEDKLPLNHNRYPVCEIK